MKLKKQIADHTEAEVEKEAGPGHVSGQGKVSAQMNYLQEKITDLEM